MIKRLIIFFGIILITEISMGQLFPHLTFINGTLTIANKIVGYLSFCGFLFCLPLLFRASKWVTIPLGIVLVIFWFIASCGEIYPIDTTTKPIDIAILRVDKDGKKLVVREYMNAKTNASIRDTVLVKDIYVFRILLDKQQK